MELNERAQTFPRFNVRFSRIVLGTEILLHLLVFMSILLLFEGGLRIAFTLLLFLMAVHFFDTESVLRAFPKGSVIELRPDPPMVIWHQPDWQNSFASSDMTVTMTRWFVVLHLGRGCACRRKILLADSFDSRTLYTRFRRHLHEMNLC